MSTDTLPVIKPNSPPFTFRHGVHPEEKKKPTHQKTIERMPFVEEYVLPLSQHIGAPSKPVVAPGDKVGRGQLIAEPAGFISTACHAPVTGKVMAIERRPHPSGKLMDAIIIRKDPFSSQRLLVSRPLDTSDNNKVVKQVQQAGIVGLGGAAFPSHVKLLPPKDDSRAQFAILNGCECEPYLTCDHRLMAERADTIIRGLRLIMAQVEVKRGYVGIEINKDDAIEALRRVVKDDETINIMPLQVKYPQGAEKMLIDAIFKREVPCVSKKGLPINVGATSFNVGTVAAIADLRDTGQPLIERVVTVTGPAISQPKNLLVPIGTPVIKVLEHCGIDYDHLKQFIMGGPMMGMAQKNLDPPVVKGTSGLLALDTREVCEKVEMPCIRCGRCLDACPMFLNPSRLAMLTRCDMVDELEFYHQENCFECGACSFVCPSHIPLAQLMRLGKGLLREKQIKDQNQNK